MGTDADGRRDDGLELVLTDWVFGTEELSNYSQYIQRVEKTPYVVMHKGDASRLGVSRNGEVLLRLPGGSLRVALRVEENVAPGVMVMPRHRQLEWQKLGGHPIRVRPDFIEQCED